MKRENEYRVIDGWLKSRNLPEKGASGKPGYLLFSGSKKACMRWIMDGLHGTDGAERDHYVDLLLQLEDGSKELDYRRV